MHTCVVISRQLKNKKKNTVRVQPSFMILFPESVTTCENELV